MGPDAMILVFWMFLLDFKEKQIIVPHKQKEQVL